MSEQFQPNLGRYESRGTWLYCWIYEFEFLINSLNIKAERRSGVREYIWTTVTTQPHGSAINKQRNTKCTLSNEWTQTIQLSFLPQQFSYKGTLTTIKGVFVTVKDNFEEGFPHWSSTFPLIAFFFSLPLNTTTLTF
jgi:hypothetical protein